MAAPKNRGLGKGLEALFGDVEINTSKMDTAEVLQEESQRIDAEKNKKEKKPDADENSVVFIDINKIKPNENQPRKKFDEEKIAELAASIIEHGIIQPIVVRKSTAGSYEIVAGERRYRAARKAELKAVPCIVRELTDEQNMLLAIIENMQREDLNPLEEAQAIEKMIKNYGLTQEQVSKSLAKSRPYITNALRLLRLPERVQDMISGGTLSAGHARALVSINDERMQIALAERVEKEGLSVRDIERLADANKKTPRPAAKVKKKSADIVGLEEDLKDIFGTKVNLVEKGKRGKIEIEYYSRDELERLIEIMRSLK